jgi:hypothetical protein
MEKESGRDVGITVSKKCCKDEHKEMKTDKDQKAIQADFQLSKITPATTVIHFFSMPAFDFSPIALRNPKANSLYLFNKQSIFLLNRNFRI